MDKKSILIVPGGQREMAKSSPSSKHLILVIKHKGFIRMALEHGASLVPILSFGEVQTMSNVYLPSIQSWTLKHLGVGFPVLPYGRWFSPIPNSVPITVIIGEPIHLDKVKNPDENLINSIHTKYYAQIRQLFEQHKEEAGYPDCELIYKEH